MNGRTFSQKPRKRGKAKGHSRAVDWDHMVASWQQQKRRGLAEEEEKETEEVKLLSTGAAAVLDRE